MVINRDIVIPGVLFPGVISREDALVFEIRSGLSVGNALGSWLFVSSVVSSLIIGEVIRRTGMGGDMTITSTSANHDYR